MDTLIWLAQLFVGPLLWLIIFLVFARYVIIPLINYLVVRKMIKEQQQLKKEYLEHKAKIKAEMQKSNEENIG